MKRGRMAVAIVVLVIGTGVASPGEPTASGPAASDLGLNVVSLDKLQGQPVDIAPWAYAWQSRAAGEDRRGIVLPPVYVPGDRRVLDTPTVTASVLFDTTGPERAGCFSAWRNATS